VLGRTIKIDRDTGDVNLREFTVLVIQANTESFFRTITLKGPVPFGR
jgi:hypothetical protein